MRKRIGLQNLSTARSMFRITPDELEIKERKGLSRPIKPSRLEITRINKRSKLLRKSLEPVTVIHRVSMTRQDFDRYRSPLVYIFKEAGVILYVGKSQHGLCRPLAPVHNAWGARNRADEVELLFCKTEAEAYRLETRLIREHWPQYNLSHR